jgi:hypothetical protein
MKVMTEVPRCPKYQSRAFTITKDVFRFVLVNFEAVLLIFS